MLFNLFFLSQIYNFYSKGKFAVERPFLSILLSRVISVHCQFDLKPGWLRATTN